MAAATLTHDTLLPRAPGGLAPGAALALLAHAGLLLALTNAIDWRTQAPEVISAELWAAVPQMAAPRPEPAPALAPEPAPPPPPPTPTPTPVKTEPPPRPDADIATERAEKRKADAEQKRRADEAQKARDLKAQAEATRQQQAEAERTAKAEQKRRDAAREAARELLADEARLTEQREQNLRRMMGQAGPGNPGSRGTAAQDAAPSAAYSGRLIALIRANTVFTGSVPDSAVAEVEVRAAASGTVLSRRLLKSSGHADWDEAVLRAIDRTSRLPRDTDGRVPPVIIIAFKPRE